VIVLRARKLWTIAVDGTARAAFRRGRIAPSIELLPLLRDVRAATVLDVGANVGQFSLLATMHLGPTKVIAFEPLPGAAEAYERVLGADPRIVLHRCAVGAAASTMTLHVSRADDSSIATAHHRAADGGLPWHGRGEDHPGGGATTRRRRRRRGAPGARAPQAGRAGLDGVAAAPAVVVDGPFFGYQVPVDIGPGATATVEATPSEEATLSLRVDLLGAPRLRGGS
jgi:hypothetical protein